jgi:DNA replication protein DnaC
MSDTPQVLLQHHLRKLKLPTFQSEHAKLARQCAAEGKDHVQYLLRLCELELIERERRMIERRIKAAKFPVTGIGLAACQKGRKVGFTTAAILVHELMEAVDDRRLQRPQKSLASHDLLIIDELGFVPLSKTGAELLFEVISQRYERGSIIITSNLPFDEWTAGVLTPDEIVSRPFYDTDAPPASTERPNHTETNRDAGNRRGEVLKLLEIGLGCRPAGVADDHHRRLPPAAAGSTPWRREYRRRCAPARR